MQTDDFSLRYFWLLLLLCFGTNILSAQTETPAPTLAFGGYLEPYYSYDFNNPKADGNRPGFFYSYNRHNEFNVNLGFVKANYAAQRVRANAAIAAGTYMNANYAAEPGVLKNILEMNAGLCLSKNRDLWVDAGIFASHIGFESAIGKDCRNLTRGINGVIIATGTPNGFGVLGLSLNFDYAVLPNAMWRIEGRFLNCRDDIFLKNNELVSTNAFVTTSLAVSF